MATHSSILAWRIAWTKEAGGLQLTGSQKVRHDWVSNIHTHTSSRVHHIYLTPPRQHQNKLEFDSVTEYGGPDKLPCETDHHTRGSWRWEPGEHEAGWMFPELWSVRRGARATHAAQHGI